MDNRAKIEALEKILASGVSSYSIEGQTTTYRNASDIRGEIERLKRLDTTGFYPRRRRINRIDLGGF